MGTRRIVRPRYGMVVTDGIAGRVFMLLAQVSAAARGDDRLVWDALRISTSDSPPVYEQGEMARVFLAPGEWAEVVADEPTAAAVYYPFVGGPADGRTYTTDGSPTFRVPVLTPLTAYSSASAAMRVAPLVTTVDYELRRDGRYHLVGGS